MMEEVMRYCHNYFVHDVIMGTFTIEDGEIVDKDFTDKIKDGQFYLVSGSVFSDGVHQYAFDTLTDEKFKGSIALLAVPSTFIRTVELIEKFEEENKDGNPCIYSENFGGYSYRKNTDRDGTPLTWQKAFKHSLNCFKKV